jgi:hypothetical protein
LFIYIFATATPLWHNGPNENLVLCYKCRLHFIDKIGLNTNLENNQMNHLQPIKMFHNLLLNMREPEKQSNESSPDNILLYDNVNKCIPNNEIGIGCNLMILPH